MTALQDKSILITRPEEQSALFRSLLEAQGAVAVCLPTIQIVDPDSWQECDAAIWKLAEYFGVCFTSKNAVEKFIGRIRSIRPNALHTLEDCKLFAVGEKTKSVLETSGFTAASMPKHASALELAASLQEFDVRGKHILFPKSALARTELPAQLRQNGACVDEVVVYNTILPAVKNLDSVRRQLEEKKIDVITFFSPSSVTNTLEMIAPEMLAKTTLAAVGPTTAETMRQLDLTPHIIAKQATAESMVEALKLYYSKSIL